MFGYTPLTSSNMMQPEMYWPRPVRQGRDQVGRIDALQLAREALGASLCSIKIDHYLSQLSPMQRRLVQRAPGVVYISSRHSRRFSLVSSMPTAMRRLPVVALLSSEARMPLPRWAMYLAVAFSSAANGLLACGQKHEEQGCLDY